MVVKLKTIVSGALAALCAAALWGCGGGRWWGDESMPQAAEEAATERPRSSDCRMPAPMDSLRPRLERRMREIFNDSNYLQLAHARHMGIRPIARPADVFASDRPVVRVRDTDTYRLDTLRHSVPFLVPEAARLLDDLARAFNDTLSRRGLPPLRLKVTSLLRTQSSVKKLRRVNRNATEFSTHQYATTFDVSYLRFYDRRGTEVYDPRYRLALAEAVYDLRAADRCMVKYEVKSPCFHITVIR